MVAVSRFARCAAGCFGGLVEDPGQGWLPVRGAVACLAVLSLLLGGCSGGSGGDGGDNPSGDGATGSRPEPSTQQFPFSIGAGAGLPGLPGVLPLDDEALLPFEVPAGYASLAATVEWQCATAALCSLEVELRHGNQDIVTGTFGDSPLTMAVDAPEAGRYTFAAFPDGGGSVLLGLEGTLTIDLS
ncbi:MAG: hypothetical protein QOC71_77 [Thermoplasmata archaeon]|jgi:hypothetical protein|nr:hypothetical protein [Thermoplasmata archaeon]